MLGAECFVLVRFPYTKRCEGTKMIPATTAPVAKFPYTKRCEGTKMQV